MSTNAKVQVTDAKPSMSNASSVAVALLAGAVLIAVIVAVSLGGGPQGVDYLASAALP